MTVIFLFLCVGILLFGFVVLFGAPYVPTLSRSTADVFDLLDLRPGQKLLDLGCGDGRILIAAAKRRIYSVGYEINPVLAVYAWLATRKYRKYASVRWTNFWDIDWPSADAIYAFMAGPYMKRLEAKLKKEVRSPVKLASLGFQLPGRKPERTLNDIHLYCLKPRGRLP